MRWLRRLDTSLSSLQGRADSGKMGVGFVVVKVAVGQVFLGVFQPFPVISFPSMLPSHSLMCLRRYLTGVTTTRHKQFSSTKYYSSCWHAREAYRDPRFKAFSKERRRRLLDLTYCKYMNGEEIINYGTNIFVMHGYGRSCRLNFGSRSSPRWPTPFIM